MHLRRLLIHQLSFLQLAAAVVLLSGQIIRLTTPYLPNIPSQHTFHGQISHRLLLNVFLDDMEGKPGLGFG